MLVRMTAVLVASFAFSSSAMAFQCDSCPNVKAGDANGDGTVDIADMIVIFDYLWGDGDKPCEGGDVNGDGRIDIADAIYITNYLFNGGDKPVDPC